MKPFEIKLAKEVRKRPHLYDSSSRGYRDGQLSAASWNEIAGTLEVDSGVCRQTWATLRSEFARANKQMMLTPSAYGRVRRTDVISQLSWLLHFSKDRETESDCLHSEEMKESVTSASSSPDPCLSPSPSGSSGQRRPRKRRHGTMDHLIMKRLEGIDQQREQLQQLNGEDTKFALGMADILRGLPPRQKSLAKFKIHQLLFETEQEQEQEQE